MIYTKLRRKIKKVIFSFWNRFERNNDPNSRTVKIALWLLKDEFKKVGKNVNLQKGVQIVGHQNISIGDNSGLGRHSYIFANSDVTIGDNVLIGPEVIIHTSNHMTSRTQKIIEQSYTHKSIEIHDDVWIGARACILSGVTVREGTIVGAASVVTKSTEPYCIYAGVPAKKIGMRK